MHKIVLMMSVSVDGYTEGPGREIDWHLVDDELHRHFNEVLDAMAGFISGRVTHELMVSFWPTADEDPTQPEPVREYARIWREKPKFVYSRTLETTDWNTTVIREVDPDEMAILKASHDGDLALGGADLAASFFAYDLVDEVRLYVHPVLLGHGTPLFPKADIRKTLHLIETRTFGNGVVLLHYERPGAHHA